MKAGTPGNSRVRWQMGCRIGHSTPGNRCASHFLGTKTSIKTDYTEPMSFWHIFSQTGHSVASVPGRAGKDTKTSGGSSAIIRGLWRQTLLPGREEDWTNYGKGR